MAVRYLNLVLRYARNLNKHRKLHDLIPALHTDLSRSGLGIPGAHCKIGTAETITPGLRARMTCAVGFSPSDEEEDRTSR